MDSDPVPDVFRWTYNGSVRDDVVSSSRQLPVQVGPKQYRSVLSYTPTSEAEFGDVTCVAKNKLGVQQEPCVISIFHAGELEEVYCIICVRAHVSSAWRDLNGQSYRSTISSGTVKLEERASVMRAIVYLISYRNHILY